MNYNAKLEKLASTRNALAGIGIGNIISGLLILTTHLFVYGIYLAISGVVLLLIALGITLRYRKV